MRHGFVAVVLGALSACGGSGTGDPLSACKSGIDAVCNKAFQCFPAEFQQLYGSLSGCITQFGAATCTTAATTCPPGTSFNSSNASRCVDDYKNESCTDLGNNNIPPSCLQTCT